MSLFNSIKTRSIRSGILAVTLTCVLSASQAWSGEAPCQFVRGDFDGRGVVDFSDGLAVLAFIYLNSPEPAYDCLDSLDADDNGSIDLGDVAYIFRFGSSIGPPPPPPYPAEGTDPTPGTTIPAERDERFTFEMGSAVGFASNTGLTIPIRMTTTVELRALQMVFEFDGDTLRLDEMLPDGTVLSAVNAEYIIHQAFNRPGTAHGSFSALVNLVTPGEDRVIPAGDHLVGNLVFSVSLLARPGVTPISFVDGVVLNQNVGTPVDNLVITKNGVFRPQFVNGNASIQIAFVRGDATRDARVDLADPIRILSFLFSGGVITCLDSADVNNDSRLDIADPVFCLRYLFVGGPQPSSPYPLPGVDPADDESHSVGCEG